MLTCPHESKGKSTMLTKVKSEFLIGMKTFFFCYIEGNLLLFPLQFIFLSLYFPVHQMTFTKLIDHLC